MLFMRLSLVALLLPALVACGGGDDASGADANAAASPEATALEDAAEECGDEQVGNYLDPDNQVAASTYITIEDDGETLMIDDGDQFSTPQIGLCVLEELDAPASTVSKMQSTTALMGRQTDEFDDYEATWSYHPDNGLDLILEHES